MLFVNCVRLPFSYYFGQPPSPLPIYGSQMELVGSNLVKHLKEGLCAAKLSAKVISCTITSKSVFENNLQYLRQPAAPQDFTVDTNDYSSKSQNFLMNLSKKYSPSETESL